MNMTEYHAMIKHFVLKCLSAKEKRMLLHGWNLCNSAHSNATVSNLVAEFKRGR